MQISTQNLVYLILRQFDIEWPNFVEIDSNCFGEIYVFMGSLHANFDQNRLKIKKFAKNKTLKQTTQKDK